MAKAEQAAPKNQGKFRPERPIYLNEQNTGFKTKIEVEAAIEKLRAQPYCFLVTYGEKARPFHMAFNDPKEMKEFQRACRELDITLKAPKIAVDEIEELEVSEEEGQKMPEAEATETHDDVKGRRHIDR